MYKLKFNPFTRWATRFTSPINGPTVLTIEGIGPVHYISAFVSAAICGLGVYSSILVTLERKNTFARNQAQVEHKYGALHREAFGDDAKINKFGYPDMGNNIYADLLPYKDWVSLNNAQRTHEFGYQHALVLFPNAFIAMLSFPNFACTMLSTYAVMRFFNIRGYTSVEGHNKAFLTEISLRFHLLVLCMGAFASAFKISGGQQLVR